MCCFSVATPVGILGRIFAPAVHVSATNIFARMLPQQTQALAYGMNLKTRSEVAMILPLPIAKEQGEEAVRFVDLSQHARMFEELHQLFEPPQAKSRGPLASLSSSSQPRLKVYEVGSFVASYVPGRADFERLDPRFRLPKILFDAVPRYADYGFAVFQLAPGKHTVHPMAFTFPTRSERLYFPTVHLHDGKFHQRAKFDHALYFQSAAQPPPNVERAWKHPRREYEGLLVKEQPLLRLELRGKLPNEDTWL